MDPKEIGPAVARGIEQGKKGKPALIDVITWRRGEAA